MPPHPPRHGDGSSSHIHSGRQLCRGCGVLQANAFVMLHRYSKTHSRDSPSDRLGKRLWGSSRRKPCYVPPTAIPLWEALSASTLRGRQEHSLCLQQINRVLGCTSSYNTPARAWWGNRTYQLSPHPLTITTPTEHTELVRCWLSQNLLQQSLAYLMYLLIFFIY